MQNIAPKANTADHFNILSIANIGGKANVIIIIYFCRFCLLMKKIPLPSYLEYAQYYEPFIQQVDATKSVLDQLKSNAKSLVSLLQTLPENQLTTPYAEGKWSIKDIVMHLVDFERVALYRAMRFARNDKSPLPFFDENEFAKEAQANLILSKKLWKEYMLTRQSTIAFFVNLPTKTMQRAGMASNYTMSVRACAYIICGHELHHQHIIQTKYLSNPLS